MTRWVLWEPYKGANKMKRILYFSGHRLSAYEWQKNKLTDHIEFAPDEHGFELFNQYLQACSDKPVYLLVDIIEEEFRHENIPHVFGADRKALITRHFDRFFRGTAFRYCKVQGREKTDRRDDRALFSALTNPRVFNAWLDIINESHVPLKGIYSLPLVTEKILPSLKLNKGFVMVVSQQVQGSLRQSVFNDGALILSRLVPVSSFFDGNYGEDVAGDIENTYRYLLTQKQVKRDSKLTAYVITSGRHYESVLEACVGHDNLEYIVTRLSDVYDTMKLDLPRETELSDALYAGAMSKFNCSNHYARKQDRVYLNYYNTSLAFKFAAAIMFLSSIIWSSSNVIDGILFDQNRGNVASLAIRYEYKYQDLKDKSLQLPVSTTVLKQAVDSAQAMETKYRQDPELMLRLLSRDLEGFTNIKLGTINWFLADDPSRPSASTVTWGKKKRSRRRSRGSADKKNALDMYEIIIFDAEITNFLDDYRYALGVLSDLEQTMRDSQNYFNVTVLEKPINLGSATSLSGSEGSGGSGKGKRVAKFKIKLVRQVEA